MDKETLPRWGWLLLGLIAAAFIAGMFNFTVLRPRGLAEEFEVVTTITLMAPILIYVGLWYDEHRQPYWEQSRAHIVGDVVFVLAGALTGSAAVVAMIGGFDLSRIITDILAMVGGFLFAWGLFWWRNTEIYSTDGE
ncbi:hypothetical protein [Natronobiforma cellulositropha]|uniref:hypothetical protein n=1 Tax=Natronobiforma cellulositropha TaxID=1679076 RepID=UPI0021D5E8E6|nr:hypothetical protein [Natronobiforma cellulositropha]